MGMSQMCTGAGDYFRTSKPHSEKLCNGILITGQSFYLQKSYKPLLHKNKTSKTLLLFSPNRLDWPNRDSTKTAAILD